MNSAQFTYPALVRSMVIGFAATPIVRLARTLAHFLPTRWPQDMEGDTPWSRQTAMVGIAVGLGMASTRGCSQWYRLRTS